MRRLCNTAATFGVVLARQCSSSLLRVPAMHRGLGGRLRARVRYYAK